MNEKKKKVGYLFFQKGSLLLAVASRAFMISLLFR